MEKQKRNIVIMIIVVSITWGLLILYICGNNPFSNFIEDIAVGRRIISGYVNYADILEIYCPRNAHIIKYDEQKYLSIGFPGDKIRGLIVIETTNENFEPSFNEKKYKDDTLNGMKVKIYEEADPDKMYIVEIFPENLKIVIRGWSEITGMHVLQKSIQAIKWLKGKEKKVSK